MKKIVFLSVLFAAGIVMTESSLAAINCAVPPSCADLGYRDQVGTCPNKYIVCPFDKTMGTCLAEASVGEVAYFPKSVSNGWLKCDGTQYSKEKYPELFAYLGTTFCTSDHGGTCTTDYFRVPKYTGYFLRVYGAPSSTYGGSGNYSLVTPQKEQLPNITGTFNADDMSASVVSGAFTYTSLSGKTGPSGEGSGGKIEFSAANSNSIYKAGGHVIPANIGVYAYIYAGKVGEAYASKTCEFGDFYSDSACYAADKGSMMVYLRQNELLVSYGAVLVTGSAYSDWISAQNSMVSDTIVLLAKDDIVNNKGLLTWMEAKPGACVLSSDGIFAISSNGMTFEQRTNNETEYNKSCKTTGVILAWKQKTTTN